MDSRTILLLSFWLTPDLLPLLPELHCVHHSQAACYDRLEP